jgi:hypothetical protein
MVKKKLIYLFLIIIIIFFLAFYLNIREPFVVEEQSTIKQINTIITLFNDDLCPITKIIVDDLKAEKEGNESAAKAQLEEDAEGPLFPCPPPIDPLQLPADIDKQIERSLVFFEKKLKEMKKKVEEALTTCPSAEGFQDSSDLTQTPTCCISAQTPLGVKNIVLTEDDKKRILEQRLQVLSNLMKQQKIVELFAKVKVDAEELRLAKEKAEAGELKPNCPQ